MAADKLYNSQQLDFENQDMSVNNETDFDSWAYMKTFRTDVTDGMAL